MGWKHSGVPPVGAVTARRFLPSSRWRGKKATEILRELLHPAGGGGHRAPQRPHPGSSGTPRFVSCFRSSFRGTAPAHSSISKVFWRLLENGFAAVVIVLPPGC